MQTLLRQSVGIDIAKNSFTACLCQLDANQTLMYSAVVTFENTATGFNQLLKWVRKQASKDIAITYVMEATGVYYEPLAYHLHKIKQAVRVILPRGGPTNKVKHFAKSLNIKSKTDAIDARLIAQLGIERILDAWQPAPVIFRELRALTRFYTALKQQRTAISNWKESLDSGHQPLEFVRKSNQSLLQTLDRQIQQCQQQIQQLIAREAWLAAKVKKLLTIKGIGMVTVAIVLAETQGFGTITNAKQLASYAGYDVVERQSGSSIKGQTRISKKGNSHIRAALHFPVLVASRHNPTLHQVYQRINQSKASKMVGATALQRKLLLLMYALWKNDTEYQERESKPAADTQEPQMLISDQNEIGRSVDLPTQDEQLLVASEVLLPLQSS